MTGQLTPIFENDKLVDVLIPEAFWDPLFFGDMQRNSSFFYSLIALFFEPEVAPQVWDKLKRGGETQGAACDLLQALREIRAAKKSGKEVSAEALERARRLFEHLKSKNHLLFRWFCCFSYALQDLSSLHEGVQSAAEEIESNCLRAQLGAWLALGVGPWCLAPEDLNFAYFTRQTSLHLTLLSSGLLQSDRFVFGCLVTLLRLKKVAVEAITANFSQMFSRCWPDNLDALLPFLRSKMFAGAPPLCFPPVMLGDFTDDAVLGGIDAYKSAVQRLDPQSNTYQVDLQKTKKFWFLLHLVRSGCVAAIYHFISFCLIGADGFKLPKLHTNILFVNHLYLSSQEQALWGQLKPDDNQRKLLNLAYIALARGIFGVLVVLAQGLVCGKIKLGELAVERLALVKAEQEAFVAAQEQDSTIDGALALLSAVLHRRIIGPLLDQVVKLRDRLEEGKRKAKQQPQPSQEQPQRVASNAAFAVTAPPSDSLAMAMQKQQQRLLLLAQQQVAQSQTEREKALAKQNASAVPLPVGPTVQLVAGGNSVSSSRAAAASFSSFSSNMSGKRSAGDALGPNAPVSPAVKPRAPELTPSLAFAQPTFALTPSSTLFSAANAASSTVAAAVAPSVDLNQYREPLVSWRASIDTLQPFLSGFRKTFTEDAIFDVFSSLFKFVSFTLGNCLDSAAKNDLRVFLQALSQVNDGLSSLKKVVVCFLEKQGENKDAGLVAFDTSFQKLCAEMSGLLEKLKPKEVVPLRQVASVARI